MPPRNNKRSQQIIPFFIASFFSLLANKLESPTHVGFELQHQLLLRGGTLNRTYGTY